MYSWTGVILFLLFFLLFLKKKWYFTTYHHRKITVDGGWPLPCMYINNIIICPVEPAVLFLYLCIQWKTAKNLTPVSWETANQRREFIIFHVLKCQRIYHFYWTLFLSSNPHRSNSTSQRTLKAQVEPWVVKAAKWGCWSFRPLLFILQH